MLAVSSMLLSVVLFSIYPLLAAFGLLSGDPVLFVAVAHIFSALASFVFGGGLLSKSYKGKKSFTEVFQIPRNIWWYIITTAIAASIAHTCFMFALLKTSKIGATIVYETWPILAIWLTPLLVAKAWDKVRKMDYVFGSLAIIGVIFVVTSENKEVLLDFSFNTLLEMSVTEYWGYILAGIGSVGIALSTVLRGSVSQYFTERYDGNVLLSACLSSGLTRLATLPCFMIVFFVLYKNGISVFEFGDMFLAAVVGIMIYMGGTLTYTYGFLKTTNANIHILYYLAPILSIVWLQFFGLSSINDFVVLGALFVITANLLVAVKAEHSYSYTASILTLLLGGAFCYFSIGKNLDDFYEAISFTSVFYAILVSFAWDRVISSNRDEEALTLQIAYNVEDMLHQKSTGKTATAKLRQKFTTYVTEILNSSDREYIGKKYKSLSSMKSKMRTQLAKEIYVDLDQLILFKLRDVMLSEIVLLTLIGATTVFGVLVYRPDSLWGDMAAAIMSVAIIFILFAIFDQVADRKKTSIVKNKDNHFEIQNGFFQSTHQFNVISIIMIALMLVVFIGLFLHKHA